MMTMTMTMTMTMRSARTAAAASGRSPLVSRLAVRSRSAHTGSAFTGSLQSQSHLPQSQSSSTHSHRIDTRYTNTIATGTFPSSRNCYALQQVSWYSSHAKDTVTGTPKSTDNDDDQDSGNDNDHSNSTSTSSDISPGTSSLPSWEIPGAQKGGRKLAVVFTCTVCDTRSAKQFTEQAYTAGVVLVRCPGCQNLHLIADRLGYFQEEHWDLESLVQQKGEQLRTVNDDNVWELTLEDLVGTEKMNRVLQSIQEDDKDTDERENENETTDKEKDKEKEKDDPPSKV